MQIAALLFATLTILMIVFSRLHFVSPSMVLAGSWTFVVGMQSIFADDMVSSFLATAAIFLITLSFALGELLAISYLTFKKSDFSAKHKIVSSDENTAFDEARLKKIVLFFAVFGLLGAAFYAAALGLFQAGSFSELLSLPGVAREQIFTGDLQVPLLSRIGFVFAYSGVVLALSYYYLFRWRWWLILPVFSVLVLGMSQSGRAGTVLVILQIILVVYLKNILIFGSGYFISIYRSALLPAIVLGFVFVGGQFLREGFSSTEGGDIFRVLYSLRAYLFGGVSAFASWFDTSNDWSMPTFGRYSFSSLFDALGIFPQAPGIYDEYMPISDFGETSNIFTAYRSFIDDFSFFGACIFYGLAGFFVALFNWFLIVGRSYFISLVIPFLSWLAFSPMASLTYFNSFLISCFLPFFLIRFLVLKDEGN